MQRIKKLQIGNPKMTGMTVKGTHTHRQGTHQSYGTPNGNLCKTIMRQGINEPFNAPGNNRGPKDGGREEEEQEQWVNIRITLHLHSNLHQR